MLIKKSKKKNILCHDTFKSEDNNALRRESKSLEALISLGPAEAAAGQEGGVRGGADDPHAQRVPGADRAPLLPGMFPGGI